ncbi:MULTISPECIES: amino acid ABC transporter permease [unclassified Paenibacillus]|uniref:amino acid ABC transporter permease n=1 Tax=unclassified Paenibacillus TaxID=185978 RepID=UPI000956ACB2|nr:MULTISPECIES: amino acid ABC transporter permease [unclassified Paenibacillus]ASS67917.1 amino acid ABC transporter permease [Paenibacillus sp. RUD330]SIR44085.1 L-cystine transport system permease protein [Paenibacillus sp. RU4X]SIR53911.1 L-cystine transport system permease protein [Paenibacillus sp. RU4T]
MNLDPSFIWTAFLELLPAVPTTLILTLVSVVCGLSAGTALALLRYFRVPVLGRLAAGCVTVIRGTPMLTHLLLIYAGLPLLIDGLSQQYGWGWNSARIPMIGFAFLSFSVTASAYGSEVIRSGLLSVSRGQLEAALSVGMTTAQALRRIVFPQALAASVPNLSNFVIGMMHASTLAFVVSVVDINAQAEIVASTNWKFFEAFLAAAAIFWGLTIVLERISALVERRISLYNRGGVT